MVTQAEERGKVRPLVLEVVEEQSGLSEMKNYQRQICQIHIFSPIEYRIISRNSAYDRI